MINKNKVIKLKNNNYNGDHTNDHLDDHKNNASINDDHNHNHNHNSKNNINNSYNYNRLYAFIIVLLIAAIIITAFVLYASNTGYDQDSTEEAKKALSVDAVYHPLEKFVVVTFNDKTGAEIPVNLEVLGLSQSYREVMSGPFFVTHVEFNSVPKYGWAVHPIVIDMVHPEFGNIQLKTEIYQTGDVKPRTIYAIHN